MSFFSHVHMWLACMWGAGCGCTYGDCVCVCTYMRRSEIGPGNLPRLLYTTFFEAGSLSQIQSLQIQLVSLINLHPESPCVSLGAAGITGKPSMPTRHLSGFWVSELWSSCLYSRCFSC